MPTNAASPFTPNSPVPATFFSGRKHEIEVIQTRGVDQVANGNPLPFFLEGDYGIGKTSIAQYAQRLAKSQGKLLPVYTTVGGMKTVEDVVAAIVEAAVDEAARTPSLLEELKITFGKWIPEAALGPFKVDFKALKTDISTSATPRGALSILHDLSKKICDQGFGGFFIVLDEINGIASNPDFGHFLKGLIETNAIRSDPVPLLLMLCGTPERRREMIRAHRSIDRLFDVFPVTALDDEDVNAFYNKAFNSADKYVSSEALHLLMEYAEGRPYWMQLLGHNAFLADEDGDIDTEDTVSAIGETARFDLSAKLGHALEELVEGSPDFAAILRALDSTDEAVETFTKDALQAKVPSPTADHVDPFLAELQRVEVIRSTRTPGEFRFTMKLMQFYIRSVARNGG